MFIIIESISAGIGTSTNPCSEIFKGRFPFSEIEVQQVVDFIVNDIGLSNVKSFWSYHNFGQMYMLPYGYTYSPNQDFNDQV